MLALSERILDELPLERIPVFRERLHDWLAARASDALTLDERSPPLSDEARGRLRSGLASLVHEIAPAADSGKSSVATAPAPGVSG